MHFSTLTSKGQTTIPKYVRKLLGLEPNDTIIYVPDGKKVFLKPISGDILELKGVVKRKTKKPINFAELRDEVKNKVAGEAKRT